MKLNTNIKNFLVSIRFEEIIRDLLGINQKLSSIDIYDGMSKLLGPKHGNVEIEFKYSKELLPKFITFLNNSQNLNNTVAITSDLKNEKLAFKTHLGHDTDVSKDTLDISIVNEESLKVDVTIGTSVKNLSPEQKHQMLQEAVIVMNKEIAANYTNASNLLSKDSRKVLTLEEVTAVVAPSLHIKDAYINCNFEYQKSSGKLDYSFAAKINGKGFESKGEYKNSSFDGEVKFSHPKALTTSCINYLEQAYIPLIAKVNEGMIHDPTLSLKNSLALFRRYGPDVLSMLNKEGDIKRGDALIIPFHINQNETKINQKSIFEIITDERFIKLFSDPKDKNTDDKKALDN